VGVGVLVFSLALVAGIELVALGLRRRRFWAWVAGLCIFGVYAPSLFLPLGALGLWGLLDAGSRRAFGVGHGRRVSGGGTAHVARLASAVPSLPVSDLERGLGFHRDRLGFALLNRDEGMAVLRRDAVELHLWAATDERWRERDRGRPVVSGAESFLAGTASCRIEVVGVDALALELAPHGIGHPNAPLADRPWGTREFGVLDPDGNLVTFFEALPAVAEGRDGRG
jgi:catechol 2,3-dioxygenase-like lactoylglutathione lyase family enzyme